MIAIAAGGSRTCALLTGGTAACWGGTVSFSAKALTATGLAGATAIVVGGRSKACALIADGTVKCWNAGNEEAAVAVPGLTGATALSAGPAHTCALQTGGTVACWGGNGAGELGDGTTKSSDTPVPVMGVTTAISIAAGGDAAAGDLEGYTCAALADGTVACWGDNSLDQLGMGSGTSSSHVLVPTVVPGVAGATAVYSSSGGNNTCAVVSGGAVECWGKQPTVVPGVTAPARLAVGDDHACAVLADTTVACWGGNSSGQLGNGTEKASATPVAVPGLTGVMGLAAASGYSCALLAGGAVECWGDNSLGSLGTAGRTPIPVPGVSGVTAMSASSQTCVVASGGIAQCWGGNDYGQLGNTTVGNGMGIRNVGVIVPGPVVGLSGATAIAAGTYHTCALLADGTVACWGDNQEGELGTGTSGAAPVTMPVAAASLSGVTAIAAGPRFTCAVIAGGAVECWGDVQLASGAVSKMLAPTMVAGLTGARAIVASGGYTAPGHACVLLSGGTVKCWGDIAASPTPVDVPGLSGVTAIASGTEHACALISDGTVACWGTSDRGQLGNGRMGAAGVLTSTPAKVAGLKGAIAVAAGGSHSCAALMDGTARCWGSNGDGELGDGGRDASATPVVVTGLTGVTNIVAGQSHTCAILAGGTIACWGFAGAIANGTTTPVPLLLL